MINKKIKITEVGPRDGLQNESKQISTQNKLTYINLLLEAGFENLEITSFVRHDKIPQLSDSYELSNLLPLKIKNKCIVLVPNMIGYEKARECDYSRIAVFTAASESFTKKNINMSIEESISKIKEIGKRAISDNIKIRLYISTVVHCPYEGYIQPEKVLEILKKLTDINPIEISLGETIGLAIPSEIEKLLNLLLKTFPPEILAGHYHDTYGFALANIQKSIELGIQSFDSSSGGLGGCPYAKGASGNIGTEDLIFYLSRNGMETGIKIDKILDASKFIEKLLDKKLSSKTYHALISKKD